MTNNPLSRNSSKKMTTPLKKSSDNNNNDNEDEEENDNNYKSDNKKDLIYGDDAKEGCSVFIRGLPFDAVLYYYYY